MSPVEEIKAAFTRFRYLENWDFESIWPIATTVVFLGILLLANKWLVKEFKRLKSKEGISEDE